jgi:hypothetical protein
MSFTFNATIKSFFLPGDGDEAKRDFLGQLKGRGETYLVAYAFTLDAMIGELLEAHAAGIPIHIYLDQSQSEGTAEKPQVARLVQAGMDVTIGTSPAGSAYICHTKGMVVLDKPARPYCWSGSVNFSVLDFPLSPTQRKDFLECKTPSARCLPRWPLSSPAWPPRSWPPCSN